MDHVVLDLEVATPVEDVDGGWDATELLGVSVACLWEHDTRRMRVYGQDELSVLKSRLMRADRITGFNTWRHDFPVLWAVPQKTWFAGPDTPESDSDIQRLKAVLSQKSDDLLYRIWKALGLDPLVFSDAHRGWGLHNVALSTIGIGKIGQSQDAARLFKGGAMAQLINYCLNDVMLTRDLSDFIDRYGYVLNTGGSDGGWSARPYRLGLTPWTGIM